MRSRKRYAVVGVSQRAIAMYMDQILNTYAQYGQIVAMLDKDASRMQKYNASRKSDIPMFKPEQFDAMIEQTKPDYVIVACQDCFHHLYVVKALEHNIDVIVEKPITIDLEKCAAIAKAKAKSRGDVRVTFNLRYTPQITKIRELISQGRIGKIVSADLNWYLDTYHSASYFQRWNRLWECSGGLNIHKCCHHYDMVHWVIDQAPSEVFAYSKLVFFGPKGVHNPLKPEQVNNTLNCLECGNRSSCKYFMRWYRHEQRANMTPDMVDVNFDVGKVYDGYIPRKCIFAPEINIEDTYAAVIKYNGGAFLSYSLNMSLPYEGFKFAVNGTLGRIEYDELHAPKRLPFPSPQGEGHVTYIPMFGGREQIDIINLGGSHNGSDPLISDEVFIGPDPLAPVNRRADFKEGIDSVLTGLAMYESSQSGKPVQIDRMREVVYS